MSWRLGKVRRLLYGSARVLGDVQAVSKGPAAVQRRLEWRVLGRLASRILGAAIRAR